MGLPDPSWSRALTRREALQRIGLGGLVLPHVLRAGAGPVVETRPHLFIRRNVRGTLRTVDALRQSIETGMHRKIWKQLQAECSAEFGASPLDCRSVFPGRYMAAAHNNNPDYTICRAAGQRILRHALAMLITEDERHKATALEQMAALFDEAVWPDWIDQAHTRFGHPVDLRTGMLAQDCGLAYDWLYPFMDTKEKAWIVEGLDRRGVQPFLISMDQDPWWWHDMNNWYSVIIGGLGVAGMALADDHPDASRLVEISHRKMIEYLSIYGEEGEFNESIAYANATRIPVNYFYAYYYHRAGGENPLAERPFPQTAAWTLYMTLPPGRFAAFGDGHADAPPQVEYMAAIASATQDPILQDFVQYHLKASANPYILLSLDGDLSTRPATGAYPLGKAFRGNGAQVTSRTSWDHEVCAMAVYGKIKRDHNHGHNDVGQVCIDGFAQRLILDPGSPSSYPPDFFDDARYEYYNASTRGHNVLMFGGREQRHPPQDRGVKGAVDWDSFGGRYLDTEFDDKRGGYWQIDLRNAYDGAREVRRTVIHLFPGLCVVLDEATLVKPDDISLRWHTRFVPVLREDGSFFVTNETAGLSARVVALDRQVLEFNLGRQEYRAPYDKDRDGNLLEQRHEPFVNMTTRGDQCRLLSLFALTTLHDRGTPWHVMEDGYRIDTHMGRYSVKVDSGYLLTENPGEGTALRVKI